MHTSPRFAVLLSSCLLLLGWSGTASAQALLTNFSDNFNRANGSLGTNYTKAAGADYIITNNTVLRTGSAATDLTYLNVGTLPTAVDFADGYYYQTSIDLFFDTQANSRLFGLLLNYSNTSTYAALAIRGDGNNSLQLRDRNGANGQVQSLTGINYATNTWYTLDVSSVGTGIYNLTLSQRGTTNVLGAATMVSTNAVAGGYVGFFSGDVGGTNNYYDNLSASVIAPATYAGGSGQWSAGFATNPTSAQNAVFAGAGGAATNDIASGTLGSVNSLFFKAGAGSYTLSAAAGSAGSATNQTLTLSNGIINNSASAQTVNLALTLNGAQTINAASNNITLGGAVGGTGTVTKTGAGTLVLTASNTYTGGTVINAGALQLGNGGTTGWLPVTSITNNATFIYNRSDELAFGTVSGTGTVMVNSGTMNTRSGSLGTTNLIINAGTVLGAGAGSFGSGNITLGNTNGGSSAATLRFANNAAPTFSNNILLGTTSGALTIQVGTENVAGTLTFAGNITGNNSLNISNVGNTVIATNLAFSGSVNNAGRINHGGASSNTTTISGNLGANVTGVTVNSGTLALSGANASFAGDAVVNSGGTLVLSGGNNRLGASGRANVTSGGVLNLGGNSQTLAELTGSGTVTNSAGVLTLDEATSTSFGGVIAGAGSVTKTGVGTAVLSGANTYTGGTLISAGTLQVGNGGSTGVVVGSITNNGALAFNRTDQYSLTNTLSGTGVIVQNGTGMLVRRNDGVGSNSVVVNAGTYQVNTGAALGVGNFTLGNTNGGSASAAMVHQDNANFTATNNIVLGTTSGTLVLGGALANRGSTGDYLLSGNISGNNSLTIAMTNSGAANLWNATFSGAINNAGRIIYTNTFANNNTVAALISGNLGANVTGVTVQSGELTLSADNTNYAGGALVAAGSTLRVGNGGASGAIAGAITNNGALAFNRTGLSTNSSTISGAGSITKSGAGTLVLSGANAYTGTTTVSAGALIVDGNMSGATGNFTVASGATLGGSGTIGGATTISGTHSPGNSPGVQTFSSSLTYSGTAPSVLWELTDNTTFQASPTPVFDQIIVNGNLDFAVPTTMTLNFAFTGSAVDWSNSLWDSDITGTLGWLVYDVGGTLSNFSNLTIATANWQDGQGDSFNDVRSGGSFTLYQQGNDIYLNYAVPEPSTYALLILAAAGLGAHVMRRRRE